MSLSIFTPFLPFAIILIFPSSAFHKKKILSNIFSITSYPCLSISTSSIPRCSSFIESIKHLVKSVKYENSIVHTITICSAEYLKRVQSYFYKFTKEITCVLQNCNW